MSRRVFNNCLNLERQAFNLSYGSLIGAALAGIIAGAAWGLLYGFGGCGAGFVIGGWLSRQWYAGNLQRHLYWHLPYSKYWLNKEVPESHHRQLM